jgi:hypothetical protein
MRTKFYFTKDNFYFEDIPVLTYHIEGGVYFIAYFSDTSLFSWGFIPSFQPRIRDIIMMDCATLGIALQMMQMVFGLHVQLDDDVSMFIEYIHNQ